MGMKEQTPKDTIYVKLNWTKIANLFKYSTLTSDLNWEDLGRVHTWSRALSPKSCEVTPCNLSRWQHGNWDLPLHTGSQVLVPSMTWMPTRQHFLEVRLGTCVESWVKQKARPNSQHKSRECVFASNNQDHNLMMINFILMVSWGSKVGTLPPCWDLLT